MERFMNIKIKTAGLVVVGTLFTTSAMAAEIKNLSDGYPERPITMIVPSSPGGGTGSMSGAIAKAFTEVTGVHVVRNHKTGAAGEVGQVAYMAYKPDGYTILTQYDGSVSRFAMDPSKPNMAKDLIPLVVTQITFSQIYSRSDEKRFTDWSSFIKWVKAENAAGRTPKIANVSDEASMERISMGLISKHYGIKIQEVSFSKSSQRYGALKGEQVDALLEQPGDVLGFLKSGNFKPILSLLKERPDVFKDVPSMTDVGLDFEPLLRFRGVYVNGDIPKDRLDWLKKTFQKAFWQEGFQAFNKAKFMDIIPSFRNTEDAITLINDSVKIYKKEFDSRKKATL
jgi:tripartite-type tricarboxylate transporter receptor subunit TctC